MNNKQLAVKIANELSEELVDNNLLIIRACHKEDYMEAQRLKRFNEQTIENASIMIFGLTGEDLKDFFMKQNEDIITKIRNRFTQDELEIVDEVIKQRK